VRLELAKLFMHHHFEISPGHVFAANGLNLAIIAGNAFEKILSK